MACCGAFHCLFACLCIDCGGAFYCLFEMRVWLAVALLIVYLHSLYRYLWRFLYLVFKCTYGLLCSLSLLFSNVCIDCGCAFHCLLVSLVSLVVGLSMVCLNCAYGLLTKPNNVTYTVNHKGWEIV